jgi:hypothetical protein
MSAPRKIDGPCRPECGLPEGTTTAQAILLAIQGGATPTLAAHWAGIHPETLTRWITHGHKLNAKQHQNPQQPPKPNEQPYIDLANNITAHEADAEMRMIAAWQAHFPNNYKAIASFMAKRFPERWGNQPRRVELSGPGGSPVAVAGVSLSLEQAEALVAQVEARSSVVGELGSGVYDAEGSVAYDADGVYDADGSDETELVV